MALAFYWRVLKRCAADSVFRNHLKTEAWNEFKKLLPGKLVTPRSRYVYCRESNPLAPGGRWLPPQNLAWRPAVYGLLFDRENHVLLVRNNSLSFYWNFPGGAMSRGETQSEALKREFMEETGLEVEIGPLVDSWDDFIVMPTGQPVHGLLHFYLVRVAGGTLLSGGNNFDVSEVGFFDNYFEDAKTDEMLSPPALRLKSLINHARQMRRSLNYDCGYSL